MNEQVTIPAITQILRCLAIYQWVDNLLSRFFIHCFRTISQISRYVAIYQWADNLPPIFIHSVHL